MPGYAVINAGVRGYYYWGTRVLVPEYGGISVEVRGY